MRRFANIRIGATGLAGLGALALAAATLSCCAAPEPPTNPAWDTDVYPILRGSCLHCHGSEFTTTGPGFRFDVCNREAFSSLDLGSEVGLGATTVAPTIGIDISNAAGRPKMPPPPGVPLNDYDRKVLQNWIEVAKKDPAAACRKASPNTKPTVQLKARRKEGNTVWATFEVADADGDAVFGKATAGNGSANIVKPGRHEVKIENATSDKITVKISDGWDSDEASFN